MPDFFRPGLSGLTTRGLIYTARGARNGLACDRKYRITAGFKQEVAKESRFANYLSDRLSTNAEPFSFSYGEHVESCAGIDFAPFVERAENRARFYYDLLVGHSGSAKAPFTILRRDWFAVPETLVVVIIYFRLDRLSKDS